MLCAQWLVYDMDGGGVMISVRGSRRTSAVGRGKEPSRLSGAARARRAVITVSELHNELFPFPLLRGGAAASSALRAAVRAAWVPAMRLSSAGSDRTGPAPPGSRCAGHAGYGPDGCR